GHYLPVIVHADGSTCRLSEGGPVLGVFGDATYEQAHVQIAPGDRLVLFTDGVTEARNQDDEEYGEDRLIHAAIENRACSAPALEARLTQDVATFTGGQLQDDATLIVVAVE
ncbi:MAG: serine/threonine-protein phosphatase, partial [Acidobacteria bacterium]|nr:serine/threonine-protein phosphatase [Acidobacteriota bacterium]